MRRGAELAVLLTAVAAQQPRAPPTATHGQREPPAQHAADEPERCSAASFRWSPGEHRINITTAQDEPFHQRSFLLLVPRTMPADGQRVPALVAWHGSSESPWYQSVLIDAQRTPTGTAGSSPSRLGRRRTTPTRAAPTTAAARSTPCAGRGSAWTSRTAASGRMDRWRAPRGAAPTTWR